LVNVDKFKGDNKMPNEVQPKVIDKVKEIISGFGDKYLDAEGNLKRHSLISALRSYDIELMSALIGDEFVSSHYTITVADKSIFLKDKFEEMLQYQSMWMGSYTQFENRIGISVGNKFINDSEDVTLDFPYKDSVLKAGMTKEDRDRDDLSADEPFFNETIAKAEIDTLLDDKILHRVKKYTVNGEEEVFNLTDEDNLVIKGNNLIALHSIKERYAGKVKCIFIDPPYYFKKTKEVDAFKYNSNFKLSTWLVFMKDRLKIAKELLQEGGTIWISVGEDGMHYLKVLADDIFGKEQFVGTIPRRTRNSKSDVPFNFSQDFDWILTYTNVTEDTSVVGRAVERKYYTTDDFPGRPWRTADATTQRNATERPNSYFTMVDPKTGKEYPASEKRTWAVTKDTFEYYYENNAIVFPDDYDFLNTTKPYMRKFKDEDDNTGKLSSVISDLQITDFLTALLMNSKNKAGNTEIDELMGREAFGYAKPENMIKAILDVATTENDLVLDFFMGSGTTQAVSMKMNRRFIGIEQMDYIDTVSVNRLNQVIKGEQGGISKDVEWQGGSSFIYAELMEKNRGYIDSVLGAQDITELRSVYARMSDEENGADLDFRVDLQKYVDTEFWLLPMDKQKQLLVKIIDKNQLYFDYSEIDDTNISCLLTDAEISFNKSFYEKGEE
jgi:adenine-specific DNA-methyltransferase